LADLGIAALGGSDPAPNGGRRTNRCGNLTARGHRDYTAINLNVMPESQGWQAALVRH
jgi:hypothetical protein